MEANPNLSVVRGPSVWTRDDYSGHHARTAARLMLAGAGAGLLLAAAARSRGHRVLLASGGASLLGLAASGRGFAEMRRWIEHQLDAWRSGDEVTESSEMSFPASDSPSWMGSGSPEPREPRC